MAPEPARQRLLIATTNPDKIRELREILGGLPVELVTPTDLGIDLEVAETGETFAANAEIKARAWHDRTGLLTLAEDSGLEIDALGGWPGVESARWAGDDYTLKNRLIVERLAGVPDERRTCRYVCVIAILDCPGRLYTATGTVEGRVAGEPRGTGGFGYDPIFYLPDRGRTMAELAPEQKHAISHRGRAARLAREILLRILAERANPSNG